LPFLFALFALFPPKSVKGNKQNMSARKDAHQGTSIPTKLSVCTDMRALLRHMGSIEFEDVAMDVAGVLGIKLQKEVWERSRTRGSPTPRTFALGSASGFASPTSPTHPLRTSITTLCKHVTDPNAVGVARALRPYMRAMELSKMPNDPRMFLTSVYMDHVRNPDNLAQLYPEMAEEKAMRRMIMLRQRTLHQTLSVPHAVSQRHNPTTRALSQGSAA
jgi:hypothetical protein